MLGQATLIDLNLDELHFYLSIISLNRCDRICNAVDDRCGRKCVPNEIVNMKPNVFNTVKGIN